MNRSILARQNRVRKLKGRITSNADDHLQRCTIPDHRTGMLCGRPTARASKQGLSAFTCRYHQQHRQRHGSHWCKSPNATVLKPYLTSALSYIEAHRSDLYIVAALAGFEGLMQSAGPVEIATRLRGLPPERRAKIALARLREADIEPERLLAICLAVAALIEEAPATVHRIHEWQIVAQAKAAQRLASGTHRRWPVPQPNGSTRTIEMHTYPRSAGRVLRHLGAMLEKESELVIEHHLGAVLALKIARAGPHPATSFAT